MDYRAVFQISAAGMGMEKQRLEVAALNLANMHSSAPAGTEGYRPLRVVARAQPADFSSLMESQAAGSGLPLPEVSIVPSGVAPRLVHAPGHPHADAAGQVSYPGVDQTAEMITVMTALRAYEANVAAVGFARAMAARALDIGGQG